MSRLLVVVAAAAIACGGREAPVALEHPPAESDRVTAPAEQPAAERPMDAPRDTFVFASYNVAGLADVLSPGTPSKTAPQISPLLNAFDLVVVQESFAYHDELTSALTFPYEVRPGRASLPKVYGDGLAVFSRFALGDVVHEEWDECHGTFDAKNDCLAEKGFRGTAVTVAPGIEIDVLNVHFDAGRSEGDVSVRREQVDQLAAFVREHAAGRALIVAGDTNMKQEDEATLLHLMASLSLRDVCRELGCPAPELHDRVFVRDSDALSLTPTSWRRDPRMKDAEGAPLSDHDCIVVELRYARRSP